MLTNDNHNGSEDVVTPWLEDGLKLVGQRSSVGHGEITTAIVYGISRCRNRHGSLSRALFEKQNFRPLPESNVE